MPIDPAFIEAVKAGIADPVGAEARGVTLADLLTKNQLGQLGLQQAKQNVALWSDPEFLQQISGVLGGGAPNLDVLGRYPQAAQGGFSALQGLAEKQADIRQKIAGAGKSDAETQKEYLSQAGHMADSVLSLADENGVVPPDKYAAVVRAAGGMGLLRLFPTPPPQPGTPEATQYLKAMRAMTPVDIEQAGYRRAQATETGVKTGLLTPEFLLKAQSEWRQEKETANKIAMDQAGTATFNNATGKWEVNRPGRDAEGNPTRVTSWTSNVYTPLAPTNQGPGDLNINLSGQSDLPNYLRKLADDYERQDRTTRRPTQSPTAGVTLGAPAPTGAPTPSTQIPIAPGGGVQTGPNLQQQKQTEALAAGVGTHLTELTTKASAAAQMQEIVKELRNKEAEGMYSGALEGTDYFRKIAGIAAAMGTLKPAEVEKLSNTTAWDAEAITLLAQSVKQFSSRPAAAELGYLAPSKPQVPQTAAAREQIYQSLYRAAARAVQEAQQADQHLKAGNNSFGNFVPKFEPVKMPPVQVGNLPTASPANKGMIAVGNDGQKKYSTGDPRAGWIDAPPDAIVAPR